MDRQCSKCGSRTTAPNERGSPHWYKDGTGGFVCYRCWSTEYRKDHRNLEYKRQYNKQYIRFKDRRIKVRNYGKHRIRFKDKRITTDANPRTGTCSKCGKSVEKGEITRTHMHHTEYDENNPLANTFELCPGCHRKAHEEDNWQSERARLLQCEIRDHLQLGQTPFDLVRMGYHSRSVYEIARKMGIKIKKYRHQPE